MKTTIQVQLIKSPYYFRQHPEDKCKDYVEIEIDIFNIKQFGEHYEDVYVFYEGDVLDIKTNKKVNPVDIGADTGPDDVGSMLRLACNIEDISIPFVELLKEMNYQLEISQQCILDLSTPDNY